MPKRSTQSKPLAREEWDFSESKVPDDELLACYYYEYARERDDIRQLAYRWREWLKDLAKAYEDACTRYPNRVESGHWDRTLSSKESATEAFWRELMPLTDVTCAQLLVNLPGFPDQPWQNLTNRREWKHVPDFYKKLENIRVGVRREFWVDVFNAVEHGDFRNFVSMSNTEVVPFRIDWQEGVEKVISDFESWARKRWAKLGGKKRARGSYREHLKQLGASRLITELGSIDAARRYSKKGNTSLYGNDDSAWSRAKSSAIKRVRDMFPIRSAG